MDYFLERLREVKRTRIELIRALLLLGSELVEIEQRFLAGERTLRIPPTVLPKALAFEDATEAFRLEIKEAFRTGFLLDIQDQLST